MSNVHEARFASIMSRNPETAFVDLCGDSITLVADKRYENSEVYSMMFGSRIYLQHASHAETYARTVQRDVFTVLDPENYRRNLELEPSRETGVGCVSGIFELHTHTEIWPTLTLLCPLSHIPYVIIF